MLKTNGSPEAHHVIAFAVALALGLGSLIDAGRQSDEGREHGQQPIYSRSFVEREVRFESGEIEIAGSLALPPGPGPFPAVIAISGAGVQDRDGSAKDAVEASIAPEILARAGIALLRTDDRGSGGSGGDSFAATFDDLVSDASAAFEFLARQPEVDGERIGLLGASQGAAIATLTATRHDGVAFLVFYSGMGLPGRDVMVAQNAAMLRAGGLPESTIDELVGLLQQGLVWIEASVDEATRRQKLRPLVEELHRLQRTSPFAVTESQVSVEREIDAITSPSFRAALDFDPRPPLRQVKCPVLVIHGDLDLQVDPNLNLPPVAEALEAAPTDDFTVLRFPGLNHFLQPAETGHMSEYAAGRRSPEVIEKTAAWIAERFVSAGGEK